MKNKSDVIIIQRIFPIYRKEIFDELHKTVPFHLLHSVDRTSIKQIGQKYSIKVKSIKYYKKSTNVILNVIPAILRLRPRVIIHEFNPSILSIYLVFLLSKLLKIKFVIWGHGYNRNEGVFNPKRNIKSRIRYQFMHKSDAIILYDHETKKLLSNYVNSSKIFVANNTIDTNVMSSLYDKYELIGKSQLKCELDWKSKYNIIYIGRLVKDKLPFEVIQAHKSLSLALNNDISTHIIGNGPLMDQLLELVHDERNIQVYGEIYDNDIISKYLFCSDLMICPGYIGLSLNHSFTMGCPVITYLQGENGPYHSPEIVYLKNNVNGFLVESFNQNKMISTIIDYLNNESLHSQFRQNARIEMKNNASIDKMVGGIIDSINYCKNKE